MKQKNVSIQRSTTLHNLFRLPYLYLSKPVISNQAPKQRDCTKKLKNKRFHF